MSKTKKTPEPVVHGAHAKHAECCCCPRCLPYSNAFKVALSWATMNIRSLPIIYAPPVP